MITTVELAQQYGVPAHRLRAKVRYHLNELRPYMKDPEKSLHEFQPRYRRIVEAILNLEDNHQKGLEKPDTDL